jgi:hypothetical protein
MKIRTVVLTCLLAAVLPVGAAVAQPAAACTAAALPELPGTTTESVTGTDGKDTYVGIARKADNSIVGVVWRDGGIEELADLFPADINASGLMGGYVIQDVFPDGDTRVAAVQQLDGPVESLTVSYSTSVNGVNDKGDAIGFVMLDHPVGFNFTVRWPVDNRDDFVDYPGNDVAARDIDELGYVVGDDGNGGGLIWGPDAAVLHDLSSTEAAIEPVDIDNGVALATRTAPGAQPVIVRIDAVSGVATEVPGSSGWVAADLAGGNVVGNSTAGATLWQSDQAVALPSLDGGLARADVVTADGTQVAGVSGARATLWTCG